MTVTLDTREQFREILAAIKAHHALAEVMQAEYSAELDAAAGAHLAAKRKKATEKAVREAQAAVCDPLQAAWEPRVEAWRTELARLTALRGDLGAELTPLPGTTRLLVREVSQTDYSSQGFSAAKYAQCSAESIADVCRHHGLETVVTRVEHESILQANKYWLIWQVHALVLEPLDVDILLYCRGPSLREVVRLAWKRGANPRVYMPFLPHGYEQQEGIDFQGRDLRAQEGLKCSNE